MRLSILLVEEKSLNHSIFYNKKSYFCNNMSMLCLNTFISKHFQGRSIIPNHPIYHHPEPPYIITLELEVYIGSDINGAPDPTKYPTNLNTTQYPNGENRTTRTRPDSEYLTRTQPDTNWVTKFLLAHNPSLWVRHDYETTMQSHRSAVAPCKIASLLHVRST